METDKEIEEIVEEMGDISLGERTFGMEIENINMQKEDVEMPSGYGWSKDEMWPIKTDKSPARRAAKRGGEINTRPLKFNRKDLAELRDFIKHIKDIGGSCMWYNAYDVHVYTGDFTVEKLKNIVYMNLMVQDHLAKIMDWVEWMALDNGAPPITAEVWNRVKDQETLEGYANVFANSTIKGHMRYRLNTILKRWNLGRLAVPATLTML